MFKDLILKKSYSSDQDNIVNDFYISVLSNSIEYNRLSGFFSSYSLAIAVRGIIPLITNKGKMKLIISPKISEKDFQVMKDSLEDPLKYIEKLMLNEIEKIESEFVRDHVFALGWMLANKFLEIKIAIVSDQGNFPLSSESVEESSIFHQKVAIFKDKNGDKISFSGSINETGLGWLGHIEEFKVFQSWIPDQKEYVNSDIDKFERFWTNSSNKVRVYSLPLAIEKKLIELVPIDFEIEKLQKWYKLEEFNVVLYQYQKDAIDLWIKNGMQGIFEMATGTGKTFTSLGCLQHAIRKKEKFFVVISCPYKHLIQQWKRELDKFGIKYEKLIIADGTNPEWRNQLTESLIDLSLGNRNLVISITTHNTFSSKDFINIISRHKEKFTIMLIADEVHGLGSEKFRNGLIEEYDKKLGLSATPKRFFDDEGTEFILDYFKGIVYQFTLNDAINKVNPATGKTYLTPYRYYPIFIELNQEEIEKYIKETMKIISKAIFIKDKKEEDEILNLLLFKRANIIKNAENKYYKLEELIDKFDPPIKYMIVYCSPQQISRVMNIINKKGIITHRFTMDEGTIPESRYGGLTERDFLLEKFGKGEYQVLVAMKCLDMGVDIPPARSAILLSNSMNPREYIQRIGRVIRSYPGKNEAQIFDFIVKPTMSSITQDLKKYERRIFQNELSRSEYIAKNSINNAEALEILYNIFLP